MESKPKRERPKVLKGKTYQIVTGCGALYVTINNDSIGTFELFATIGKTGGCASSQAEAIGRIVSLALRSGVPISRVVKQLSGITCHSTMGVKENKVSSCADAISKVIKMYIDEEEEKKKTDAVNN